jgi:hypothetical protein
MAQTTALLVTRCETRFRDSNHEVITAAEWLAYLNDAYQEVNAQFREWPWHEAEIVVSVTAGTSLYTVSSSEDYTVSSVFNDTDNYPLVPIEGGRDFRYLYPDDTTGAPEVYQWLAGQLELFPVPASNISLKVRVTGTTPDLVSGSVNPVWPDRYRRALVELALARAYMDDGNMDWADRHRVIGDAIVKDMVNDLLSGRAETYPRVNDDWWL